MLASLSMAVGKIMGAKQLEVISPEGKPLLPGSWEEMGTV